jgi:menaquinol-cytochrome c reductase iron-sulfur subunit
MRANPKGIESSPSGGRVEERRRFLTKLLALVFGSVAGLIPVGAGLRVFLSPLANVGTGGTGGTAAPKNNAIHVTNLDLLPDDGVPRKFPVVADRRDAFSVYPNVPVGAVYLRRAKDQTVTALNVACPHAGCFVDYVPGDGRYFCPCHGSSFELSGAIHDPASPSPRGMDALEVELRNNSEVWVKFQNFVAGHKGKIPVA